MNSFRVQRGAADRLDEIYVYTRDQWGEAQADRYVQGMFARFEAIATREFPWRAIPAIFGVSGFFCKYEYHFIYWKLLTDGTVGIVTILHEKMHQIDRLKDDLLL
jgi:toxin ParE1/3/4